MTEPASSNENVAPDVLWEPPPTNETVLGRFMELAEARSGESFNDFGSLHRWSIEKSEDFWSAFWDFSGIIGDKGEQVIQGIDDVPWARFFPDSKVSYAENMLAGAADRPDEPAIIARLQDSQDRVITWQDLYNEVSCWEQAFKASGLQPGDHIGVYLPNVPETVFILLAASNLGIVFASAGMEMGPDDLINRFSQVKPKLFITGDGYVHAQKKISRLDVVERAQKEIDAIERTVVISLISDDMPDISSLNKTEHHKDFVSQFEPNKITFNRRDFNDPLYILFSSGSTGKPKCFEHSTGGILLKHLCEYLLHSEVTSKSRVFYHATPSWMMWNWLVGGLAIGACILMYDGSPAFPDALAQWKFTSDNGCTHHGTAAPVILSWEKAGLTPGIGLDLSALEMVLSTGAVLPPQGFEYLHNHVKGDLKISPISGGTDIVGCFVGGNPLMPTYAGQINGPILGMDVQVWDDDGHQAKPGEAGELVCLNAFPSMPLRFLDDPDGSRYRAEYFEHYAKHEGRHVWRHGDSMEKTNEGQFVIIGRSDATLNQNGVRIGAAVIYDQLLPFADQLKDAAAVDFTRPDNSQATTILFLAVDDWENGVSEELAGAICAAVKNNVTPYAIPTEIIAVPDVLKTPNGKKAEVVMKKIISGKAIPNPSLYGVDLVHKFEEIGRELAGKYGGEA